MARAVRAAVLESRPDAELSVHIVWSGILVDDDVEAAHRASTLFDDERVHQYADMSRAVGAQMASHMAMPSLASIAERNGSDPATFERTFRRDYVHGPAAAFDTAFFYGPNASWFADSPLPVPAHWVTQLDPHVFEGVDPERYRWADDLEQESRRLAGVVLDEDAATVALRGDAHWREWYVLPDDGRLELQVVEVGADGAGRAIASVTAPSVGRSHVPFELEVPRAAFDPARSYRVDARVYVGDTLWFEPAGETSLDPADAPDELRILVRATR